jgi:hypothetical protein
VSGSFCYTIREVLHIVYTLVSPTYTRYNGDLFKRTLYIFTVYYISIPYVRSPGINSTDPGVGVA